MMILSLLFTLGVPVFLGIGLVKYLDKKEVLGSMPLIPIGFGLGFGVLTQWMLLLSMLHIQFSQWTIGVPLLAAGVFFFLKYYWRVRSRTYVPRMAAQSRDLPVTFMTVFVNVILTIYITYMVVFVCMRALMVPIIEWDAVSFIALKGKIFFYEKSIYRFQFLPNSAYPLHVPLAMAWTALNLGEWSETLVKIIFPAYFVAYAMLHYSVVRACLDKWWAKGSLALLFSAFFFNYHATIAYRDITLMFYFCGGILLILLQSRTKSNVLFMLSALFLGFASFVKLEGALYMCIGLIMISYAYCKEMTLISWKNVWGLSRILAVPIAIFLFYFVYKKLIGAVSFSQDLSMVAAPVIGTRLGHLFKIFFTELFLSANWHLTWILLVLSLVQFGKIRNSFEMRLLIGTIFLFFGAYFTLGAVTGIYKSLAGLGSSGTLPRILLHIYPLAICLIVLVNGGSPKNEYPGKGNI